VEYRGALNQLHANEEFNQRLPSLPQKFADHITQASRYFETDHQLIKDLRNDFGGHFQIKYARHATANFPAEEVGKIEWASNSTSPWFLNIDLAANIITSGLEHTLKPEGDVLKKFRSAIDIIGVAYGHVQQATYSLIYCFLWNKLQ
jgi:hypothetical protein